MKRWSFVIVALLIGVVAGSFLVGPWLHGQGQPAAPVLPKELTSYRDVVKKVLPAVVSIEAQVKVAQRINLKQKQGPRQLVPDDLQIPEQFRRFFEQDFPNMPEIPRQGFGSGFFVDGGGVVLTNNHVVDGAEFVTVTLMDGRKFSSKDIHGDPRTDLAIVRIDAKGKVPFLEFGDSDAMEIGDRVLAFGAPFGLTGSVTSGIVSAKGRNLNMNMYEDFMQTDAAINPGNSGGPLVSLDGKVIGINAAIKSKSGGFQGVGLAVASNLAKHVSSALLKDGVVHRGYLGVQIRDLAPDVARRLNLPKDTGVVIGEVFDNTPAAKAGLKPGDIITAIAGQPIKDGKTLQLTVAGLPLQKPTDVAIVRDGKVMTVAVTIEEQPKNLGGSRVPAPRQPQSAPKAMSLDKIGIAITDLTPNATEDLGYRQGTKGVVIAQVEDNSLAAMAGLRPGMLITRVENQPATAAAETRDALEKAPLDRGVLLQVQSPQGGTNFVLLRSGQEN
jgi:serine protease Do